MATENVFTIDPGSRDDKKTPHLDNKPTVVMDSPKTKSFLLKYMTVETLDLFAVFFAEMLGTAILLFFGCMGAVSGLHGVPTMVSISLNFGLAVMIALQVFGCVSGGHINPIVTIAFYIYGHITLFRSTLYIIAQFLGAILGYGALKLVTPSKYFADSLCVSAPSHDVSDVQAFFVEYIASTVLVAVCAALWDPRNRKWGDSIPIKFGLTITAIAISIGPYTGCSMNPARSLAPAIFHGDYRSHWVYWAAPLSAAVITAFAFKSVFRRDVDHKSH